MYVRLCKCFIVCLGIGFALDLPEINTGGLRVGNIVPVLVSVLYFLILQNGEKTKIEKKTRVCIDILSIVLTLFYTLSQIEVIFRYDNMLLCLVAIAFASIGLFLLFKVILEKIVYFFGENSLITNNVRNKSISFRVFCLFFLALLVAWGIQFLILYPGIFAVDSLENLEQATGALDMNVLFPFYQTLFLRFCWNIGFVVWGKGNAGIALYGVIQMICMALAVAYMFYRLYMCNVKQLPIVGMLLYFIVIPYHAHMSFFFTKDAPFAIGTLLLVQLLWEYYVFGEPKQRYARIVKCLGLILGGILMSVSRANGFYAYVFFLPFALVLFWKKEKKIVGYIVIMTVSVLLVRGPIFDYVISANNNAIAEAGYPIYDPRCEKPEPVGQEELSTESNHESATKVSNTSSSYGSSGVFIITSQQLARVAIDRELNDEQYAKLNAVIDIEEVKKTYNPYITTNAMKEIKEHDTKKYLSVWLDFGLQYPYTYFIAWRDQTSGYWDPLIYSGGVGCDFWEEDPDIYRDSFVGDNILDKYIWLCEEAFFQVPTIILMWSNGFILWITLFAMVLAMIKRGMQSVVFYTPLIGLWLTLLVANPCNASLRFMYPFYMCLPLSLVIPFVTVENVISNLEYSSKVENE